MNGNLKFYLDENIDNAVADGLRLRTMDVLTSVEAGMRGTSDEEQLDFAHRAGRVIVTKDSDFIRLHKSGIHHSGILYIPKQRSIGYIIHALQHADETFLEAEMMNSVEYI